MITFLLKATLIWSLFLLFYQLLYRKSPLFTMNRIYLFIAIAAGLLLPFIVWDASLATNSVTGASIINTNLHNLEVAAHLEEQDTASATSSINVYALLTWIY